MDLVPVIKPQYVDSIPKIKTPTGTIGASKVGQFIAKKDTLKRSDELKVVLELEKLYDREIVKLSGG